MCDPGRNRCAGRHTEDSFDRDIGQELFLDIRLSMIDISTSIFLAKGGEE